MEYILKKNLFSSKLVNNNGENLEYNKKLLKLISVGSGFVFADRTSRRTQELIGLETFDRYKFKGIAEDESQCLIDIQSGKITESFIDYSNGFIATQDGSLKFVDKDLNVSNTGYFSVLNDDKPENRKKLKMINSYNGVFDSLAIARDSAGKFGVMSLTGMVCPFVFDSPDIRLLKTFESKGKYRISCFCSGDKEVFVDDSGKIIKKQEYIGEYKLIYSDDEQQIFSVFDEKNKKTKIYTYNMFTCELEETTTLEGFVSNAYKNSDGSIIYKTIRENKSGVVNQFDKPIIEHKYDKIDLVKVKEEDDLLFCVQNKTDYKNIHGYTHYKKGVYSVSKSKEIIAPVYDDIDFDYSGKGADGVTKFFVKSDKYWGVVNENQEIEVDFNYVYNPDSKNITFRQVTNERGFRDSIMMLKIRDKNDRECYFNIGQKNIIASEEEQRAVKSYEKALADSSERDNARKLAKEKEEEERRKKIQADREKTEKEEKATSAAIAATILTKNPIAGMIVKDLMDDSGPSME